MGSPHSEYGLVAIIVEYMMVPEGAWKEMKENILDLILLRNLKPLNKLKHILYLENYYDLGSFVHA